MEPAAELVDGMARWRASPLAFVREVLGAVPDEWQVEVLLAIVESGKNRFALKASKGPGKSTLLAWIVWWFLCTRPHPKVVCTSVTEDNLKDGLWTELSKWMGNSPLLKRLFTWRKERITCNAAPETWWASARNWPKGGSNEEQANTLAGVHADHVLFVLDEAGGIPNAVAAAAEGGLANIDKAEGRTAILLIAGNPTHLDGPLYRACTKDRAQWYVKEISGDPKDPKRAPRVSKDWAEEQIRQWGADHDWVLINVFGRFPKTASNALLGPDAVNAAMKRDIPEAAWKHEVKIVGVDVARHGDDRTVIIVRQGRLVMRPRILRTNDLMVVVGQVSLVCDKVRPDALFIDNGTFGAGVVDRLAQLKYPAIGIEFGDPPVTDTKFANRRAEMWFLMSGFVGKPGSESGGVLPDMPELVPELTNCTYTFNAQNHLQLEKKAEIKKRTGVSPDIADALALTFAQPVAPRDMRELLERNNAATAKAADYDPYDRED